MHAVTIETRPSFCRLCHNACAILVEVEGGKAVRVTGDRSNPLFAGYTLRDDIAKDAARMLLLINIRADEPRKVVTYFEVVKEKAPELILSFDQLLAIGKAYRQINEYERAA